MTDQPSGERPSITTGASNLRYDYDPPHYWEPMTHFGEYGTGFQACDHCGLIRPEGEKGNEF